MTFIWPTMLFLLLAVPILALLYVRLQRRRRKLSGGYGSLGSIQQAAGRTLGWRRHLSPALFLIAFAILLVGLARPQTVVSLPRIEGTVILAFDVSGSMAADDLKPTRMEAAQAAAKQFVDNQPSTVQIGVVAFSDNGLSVQPPTNDRDAVLASIQRLKPTRGTSLANGIMASLNAITATTSPSVRIYTNLTPMPTATPTPVPQGKHSSAVIVLLSDGENNESPDPLAAAKAAAAQGIRIYTVGIGSPGGAIIHVDGFAIQTQLNEGVLQQISQLTGGTYYKAGSAQQLAQIYDQLNPELVIKPEKTEVTSLFAGAGIVVLLIGGVFSMLWLNRLP
jgi:Ca-activated chloride channel family protein